MHQDLKLKINGQELFGVIENPGQQVIVILAHGFSGDMFGPSDIFVKLSKKLQQHDYSVLRFNFRGTTPSEGNQEDMTLASEISDLKALVKYAKELGYKKVVLIGESFAGAVLARAYSKQVDLLIFWYPLFELRDCSFKDFIHIRSEKLLEDQGFFEVDGFRVGPKLYKEIINGVTYDELTKINVPTLLLHGDADRDVPYQQSEKAYELLPGIKELGLLRDADHCFKHEQAEAIERTVKFINDELLTE